jgi:SAM-dependent methyltransferase
MNESLNHSTNTRLRTSYNPTEYWIQQGRTYKDKFNYNKEFRLQEKMLLAYLKSISPKFRSVLEVGCGFGRITKLIVSNHPDIQRYVAVDLSPDQILNAEQYVRSGTDQNKANGNGLSFTVSDIQSLDLSDKFDLVLAAEVLLHILPSEIKGVMTKLVNLSNRHIINIDYYQEIMTTLATHNFLHQYRNIYEEIPSVAEVKRIPIKKTGIFGIDTKQSIFHATKRELR